MITFHKKGWLKNSIVVTLLAGNAIVAFNDEKKTSLLR